MAGEIELWSLKRFGRVPIRFDWSGSLKRSSRSGTAQPYLSLLCSAIGDSAIEEPGFAPGGKLPGSRRWHGRNDDHGRDRGAHRTPGV